jgi:hypothetical protein
VIRTEVRIQQICEKVTERFGKLLTSKWICIHCKLTTNKLHALSPQANYTDQATAACWQNWCQLLQIEECRMVSQRMAKGCILGFLDQSHYFFFQVAPQLYSQGWVDPVPDPLLLRKSGSARNRTQTSGSVARNSDHMIVNCVTS